jgi:phage terminase large subunit
VTTDRKARARALLTRWRGDPVAFASEALGFDPWERQAEAMREVAAHEHTALRSGHKIGKSTLDAALALWWWCVTPRARVILTAPTGHQVANVLWPEVRRLYLGARVPLGGRLYGTPDKGLKLDDGREIIGLNTNTPEAFAGISSPGLLFIVDEASGFPEPIFNAVFGNMAGGGRVLLTGNPTRTSGTFYEAFHSRRGSWRALHVSSLDTPNFHGGHVPGLANPAWATWAEGQWGRGTPAWACRVEGDFPSTSDDTVIGLGVVESALGRWEAAPQSGRLTAGLDVARFGDDASVLAPRRGATFSTFPRWKSLDGQQLAGKVREYLLDHREAPNERPLVKVDVIGVGASAYDHLAGCRELEAVAVNVAARARDDEHYANARAEAAFALRDLLDDGGALPAGQEWVEGELVSVRYQFDGRGRYQLEPKEKTKARLGRSPDGFDAAALSAYSPAPEAIAAGVVRSLAAAARGLARPRA